MTMVLTKLKSCVRFTKNMIVLTFVVLLSFFMVGLMSIGGGKKKVCNCVGDCSISQIFCT
jgi:hypothetical protein